MKTITKERIKNPFLFIAVLSLITVLIVSWLFGSEFLTVITYSEDYIKANGGMSKKEYLNMILPQILSWENSWMGAFTYLVNFFTLFPCLVVLEFSKELNGYFPHAVIYMKNGNMSIRKACIFYAILGGIVVSVSLLLGDIMLAPFAKAALTDIGGADDFFPKNFYVLHPFFVFNTLACTIYFLAGFAFAFMACSVAIWKNDAVFILGIPFLFYHLENFISSQLGGFMPLWSADSIVAFNTPHNILELSLPLLIIIGISIVMIEVKIHSRRGVIE